MRRMTVGLLAVIGLAAALLISCGDDAESHDDDGHTHDGDAADSAAVDRGTPVAELGHLAIYAPYIPAPPSDLAALYVVVVNGGDEADRLLSISTTAAGSTVIHETVIDGDTSRMSLAEDGLEVPAGGEVVLAPSGFHAMLVKLVEPLEVGDVVEATLEFEHAGTVLIEVPVTDGVGPMEGMSDDDDE